MSLTLDSSSCCPSVISLEDNPQLESAVSDSPVPDVSPMGTERRSESFMSPVARTILEVVSLLTGQTGIEEVVLALKKFSGRILVAPGIDPPVSRPPTSGYRLFPFSGHTSTGHKCYMLIIFIDPPGS